MPTKKQSKRPSRSSKAEQDDAEDALAAARRVVEKAIGEPLAPDKNPHAVALSRMGASKGGQARAASLTKKRRSEIARAAAKKRWSDR